MANYDAVIKLIVQGEEALTRVQKRIDNLYKTITDLETKKKYAGSQKSVEFVREQADELERVVGVSKRQLKQQEQSIVNQSKLNAAVDLYERRQRQLARSGVSNQKQFAEQIRQIEEGFKFFKERKSVVGVQAVATELGRIIEYENEINRIQEKRYANQRKVPAFLKEVQKYESFGLRTDRARESFEKFSSVASTNQLARAQSYENALRNQLRLLKEQYVEQKRISGIAPSSPIRGGLNFPGSPIAAEAALRASQRGYAASPIRGTATMAGSPAFIAAQERAQRSAAQAARAQERAAAAAQSAADRALREAQKGYPASPILGTAAMQGSPRWREAQNRIQTKMNSAAAAAERAADKALKEAQKGYPSSPILGTATMQGSPRWFAEQQKIRNQLQAKLDASNRAQQRAAAAAQKAAEAAERAAERSLKEAQQGYPSSPILGTATMQGSPRWIAAQQRIQARMEAAARAQEKAAERTKKQAEKQQIEQRGDLGGRLSSATIGGFFPLLFGQGPGAALGGAVGGFAGGGKFGFAGSLAGTFAGQATIDFAINSAVRLGQALRNPTANIEQLTKFLGIAGTALNTNIKVLQSLGLTSTASAVALAKLEETLGKEGYKNADQLAKDLSNLENAFGKLQLAAANALSQPLGQFIDFLADVVNQFNKINVRQGGGRTGRLVQVTAENPPGGVQSKQTSTTSPTNAEQIAAKAISDERSRQIRLASEQKRLDQDRLGLTRVELAIRENDITLLQSANELERKRLEYKNAQAAKDKERSALLEIELRVLEQQRAQQEAAKRNAVIEAQRAVERDKITQYNEQLQLIITTSDLRADLVTLEKGELAGIQEKGLSLEKEFAQRKAILYNQLKLNLVGVNEKDVQEQLITTYGRQLEQLKAEVDLRKTAYNQQWAQYKLTRLQVQQELQLNEVQTRAQAGMELQRLRSFQDPAGMGLFGQARAGRNLGLQEFATTSAILQTQVTAAQAAVNQAVANSANPETITQLNDVLTRQRQQLSLYQELTPTLIQARYEQEKYNEILSYTTTITDSLFNELNDVVAGTTGVQEAFGNMLNVISRMLMDFAKQVIAQYIAISVAKALAGFGTSAVSGPVGVNGTGVSESGALVFPAVPNFPGRANGGPVAAGSPYIVGERGPELFVPGRSGTIVPNDKMGGNSVQVGSINISVENTGDTLSPQAQKQIAGQVRGIVLATLVDQQRSGGVLR